MICVQDPAVLSRILVGARFLLAKEIQPKHVILTLKSHSCPQLAFYVCALSEKASLKKCMVHALVILLHYTV